VLSVLFENWPRLAAWNTSDTIVIYCSLAIPNMGKKIGANAVNVKKTFHSHFLLLIFFLPLPLPTNDTEHSAESEIILVELFFLLFFQQLKRVALNKH